MSFLSQPITLSGLFGTKRTIDSIIVDVILSEETTDTLTITKQPVQSGSSITDHSFKEPTVLTMNVLQQAESSLIPFLSLFSGNSLKQLYSSFQTLQNKRTVFTITTPKRIYNNMLMSTLRLNTDKNTENILSLGMTFQEVIIVNIGTATVIGATQQLVPAVTQPTQQGGIGTLLLQAGQNLVPGLKGVSQ